MTPHNIVLYGGGIDSTAVLFHLLEHGTETRDISLVHVDYGQKAAKPEYKAMRLFSNKYHIFCTQLRMDMTYSDSRIMTGDIGRTGEQNRLELRNVALIAYVASYGASLHARPRLHLGFHREPPGATFPDANAAYLIDLEHLLQRTTHRIVELCAPLSHLTRSDLFERAIRFDPNIVNMSYTCYEEEACGRCTHCIEKESMLKAFRAEGLVK